jgi:hypothetical protein
MGDIVVTGHQAVECLFPQATLGDAVVKGDVFQAHRCIQRRLDKLERLRPAVSDRDFNPSTAFGK